MRIRSGVSGILVPCLLIAQAASCLCSSGVAAVETHPSKRASKKMIAEYDKNGKRSLKPLNEDPVLFECDDVILAIGQENSFPWIERDIGIDFNEWGQPIVDKTTFQSSLPGTFFGGDAAWGPENIIWAVAHGHQAAISIDQYCQGIDLYERPDPITNLLSQKMGIHEWSYPNDISNSNRFAVPHADHSYALSDLQIEVELGYDEKLALDEAKRCLNCDIQTVFTENLCIECDACVDICPVDCINFIENDNEESLRLKLKVPAVNNDQDLYISDKLKTERIMAKDEDMCLHCGLCSERCPTGAWDMQKFTYIEAHAEESKIFNYVE